MSKPRPQPWLLGNSQVYFNAFIIYNQRIQLAAVTKSHKFIKMLVNINNQLTMQATFNTRLQMTETWEGFRPCERNK